MKVEKVRGSRIPYTLRVDCGRCMISYLPRTRIAVRGGTVFPPKLSSLIRTSTIGTALSSALSSPGLAHTFVDLCQHQLQWSVPELHPNDVRHTIHLYVHHTATSTPCSVGVGMHPLFKGMRYMKVLVGDDCPGYSEDTSPLLSLFLISLR